MNTMNWRIIHTHDTQANWEKLVDFIPKNGEYIVYDIDGNFSYQRFKIGDGVTKLKDLPFVIDKSVETLFNVKNNVIYVDGGKIKNYTE